MIKYLLLIALFTTSASASVQIKWDDNSDNEDGFIIERKLKSETKYTELKKLIENTTEYTDSANAKTYCYRVGAYNSTGTSYSKSQCINTKIKPNSPTLRLLLVL